MRIRIKAEIRHPWDVTPRQAMAIQQQLRAHVRVCDDYGDVRRVAGVDVGFEDSNRITRAAVAVLNFPDLALVQSAIARQPTRFPYVPGLLSFREIPAVLDAFEQLSVRPDLVLCDGQGLAHPRRFGLACHLGVLLDLPTIGVAKTRLTGEHGPVAGERGAWTALRDGDEVIGAVLRTRRGVKPLYVSVGHRISLPSALEWVMGCTTRYRLPETTRWAHRLASQK